MSTYAILRQGGHQYRVQTGDVIQVELLDVDDKAEIDLDEVLMLRNGDSVEIGSPVVAGAKVRAKVVRAGKGAKVLVYKMRRRKGFERTQGHRQPFTELKITGIYKGSTAL